MRAHVLTAAYFATALSSAAAQPCTLRDTSGRGVPYANVYVAALSTGTVSGPGGEVRLSPKLADAAPTTPITVSCIGYADRTATLADLRGPVEGCGLVLAPAAYALAEAEIVGRRLSGKRRTLGFRKDESRMMANLYQADADSAVIGGEIGNVMRVDGPWRLREVGVNVKVQAPMRFELNIYGYADGAQRALLHRERVLFDVPARTGHVHHELIELTEYDISGEGDFLVTVEPLGPSPVLPVPDSLADAQYTPWIAAKVALRKRHRITRLRTRSGQWVRLPLGVVVGIWCDVEI